jgi:hypothetical protein
VSGTFFALLGLRVDEVLFLISVEAPFSDRSGKKVPSILASQCESCILDFEIFREHPLPEAFGGGRRLVDRLFLVLRARVSARSQAVHFLNPNRR